MGLFGKKKTPEEKQEKLFDKGLSAYRVDNYAKALVFFEQAAELGYTDAQYDCGLMNELGEGTPVNYDKAFYWYEKAAKQGHALSQYNCGMMCEKGIGTQMDEEKALHWYEKAAEQGNADAQRAYEKLREIRNSEEKEFQESMQVIDMLEQGEQALFEEEYEEAISCYEWVLAHTDDEDFCEQASEGIAQAKECMEALSWLSVPSKTEAPAEKPVNEMSDEEIYQKGMDLYYAGDNKKALSLFEKAAEQGNAAAQYMMCKMYKNGIGTAEDSVEAFRWLKKAAAQGQAVALLELVEMADDYWEYDYWADDYEEAFSLFQKAAEQEGHVEAQYICGQICDGQYFGKKIEPDLSQCVMWYKEAAAQGHEKSVEELKKWEKYVRMTPEQQYQAGNEAYDNEEYVLAFMLVKEAARQVADKADVFFFLGEMYRDGCGTKTDCEKAYFWWEKAARLGDADAQYECGDACNYGDGVEKNKKKALMWYEKAAEQGNSAAQSTCGEMYDKGEGTAVDKTRALYWFEKLAGSGNYRIQADCGDRYYSGVGTAVDKAKALYWYEKAAEQGNAAAQFQCGLMYEKGEGTAANKAKAQYWFEKAAQEKASDYSWEFATTAAQAEDREIQEKAKKILRERF